MLTAPKPRSRNRRSAASTMASREPARRAFGAPSFTLLRTSMRSPYCTNECMFIYCTVQCVTSGECIAAIPIDPAGPNKPITASSSLRKALRMSRFQILTVVLIAASLAGCDRKPPPTAEARPVRTVTVEPGVEGETVSLTGQVRAKDHADLAFRLDGRMIKRLVDIGDVVKPGQVVAQLDPQNQQNMLRTAEANLAGALAIQTQARLTYDRQEKLLEGG